MGVLRSRSRQGANDQIRVLESFPPPSSSTNPYITQLARALDHEPGLHLLFFSWRTALLGRYDLVHLHWPETLLRGSSPLRRAVRVLLAALLCLRLSVTRTPVVRTWHNLDRPSGLSRVDHLLLSVLDRRTGLRILLNDFTPAPAGTSSVTIRHGHYRDWFSELPREQPTRGRLTFVGRVRPYKGVEHLIEVFSRLHDPQLTLYLAGLPSSEEVAEVVTRMAAEDPRVEVSLAYVDDAALVAAVTKAQLVVLPYRHMHNSGAVLAALSLDRPVLVPENDVNRSLSDEVGPGWVHTYDGDLRPEHLQATLRLLDDAPPSGRPDLSDREWAGAGRAHLLAFRQAVQEAGTRADSSPRGS
jgi:glycosyltransferase involved in cell wall biosynthesis